MKVGWIMPEVQMTQTPFYGVVNRTTVEFGTLLKISMNVKLFLTL